MKYQVCVLFVLVFICGCSKEMIKYPGTEKIPVSENYHGVEITDNYIWLENADDEKVREWTEKQIAFTEKHLANLPQREFIEKRLSELLRYDDKSLPIRLLDSERTFFWVKKAGSEKYVYYTKAAENSDPVKLIDPNEWDINDSLESFAPSRNGKYVAYSVASGGSEDARIFILETETKEILDDTLRGWRQDGVAWLPDSSGFYYSCNPAKGEVPDGEEHYWHRTYLHLLGTSSENDKLVFSHDTQKEYFHSVSVSESGKYTFYWRSEMDNNEVYIRRTFSDEPPVPVATGFKGKYLVEEIDGMLLIMTDEGASMGMVFTAPAASPGRESWQIFIPEDKTANLQYVNAVSGKIYAVYEKSAFSFIKIYDTGGTFLRELSLPSIGNAGVSGFWRGPETRIYFSSFTFPPVVYNYSFETDSLELIKKFPVEVDTAEFITELVWYKSADGTPVSMFIVKNRNTTLDGKNPVLLTGYGGFNVSTTPYFSSSYLIWLEAGGIITLPHLRGGGEYGREWHEAGMLGNKQNVFDDFIAAAEWLIDNKYTNPAKLAISGGSNGGLLVGAVAVQRPELFKAVDCSMPLLDMLRYHKFGFANIWKVEYGSADNPEQFEFIYKYSPYHNVKEKTAFPSMLITGSENDSRVDPLHARKMVALLQDFDTDPSEHVMLFIEKDTGHIGGATLFSYIKNASRSWSYLMDKLEMEFN